MLQGIRSGKKYILQYKNVLQKNRKKTLAICTKPMYTTTCCGMIAMKREVAAWKWQVFRGANVKLGN